MIQEEAILAVLVGFLLWTQVNDLNSKLNSFEKFCLLILVIALVLVCLMLWWQHFSKKGKERKEKMSKIENIPEQLKSHESSVRLGDECDLEIPIFLSDSIRRRHVHLLGATGSGKTESVILNFIGQDIDRGVGSIILDAKGDISFIKYLQGKVPSSKLVIFDLSDSNSVSYNPLATGSALEAAQRLFSSMTWSEEYYQSKALSVLQQLFEFHRKRYEKNPTLCELCDYLQSAQSFVAVCGDSINPKHAEREFGDLSGLRDQLRSLTVGHLGKLLNESVDGVDLNKAKKGFVIYFRLQSLLSPKAVGTLGRLIINHLNFLAGTAHREGGDAQLVPIYLDEFASFACLEFADLISKARSAGYALHFSHQSIGDLTEVSPGFVNRIADNSATKIVMRINDPDSAEFFARSFGTKIFQKITQRISGNADIQDGELQGEGTVRDAHQFRASPDLFKTLPTGVGSVLIAHGFDSEEGASHVFKIKFPKLK